MGLSMVSLFTGPACCGPRGIVNNGRVDAAELRRMLYDLGYIDREAAGSAYTLAASPPTSPE